MAFLGGATSLNEEAVEFLGLTEEQGKEVSQALKDARDGMTNLALSQITEVTTDKLEINYDALGFSIDPNSGGTKPEDAKLRIAASYSIPAMNEQGAEIEANLRSRLGLVMGDAGARIADEAKQHCEFLDFGRRDVNLLLIRNEVSSGCSVYMEFRVPGSGKLVGGDLLPFAAFNKRFGQFFESK